VVAAVGTAASLSHDHRVASLHGWAGIVLGHIINRSQTAVQVYHFSGISGNPDMSGSGGRHKLRERSGNLYGNGRLIMTLSVCTVQIIVFLLYLFCTSYVQQFESVATKTL